MADLSLLRRVPLFARLRDSELSQLSKIMSEVAFGPEDVIVRVSEVGDALYIVVSGAVEVSLKSGQGERIVVGRLGQGDYFGEMSLIDGSVRSATVRSTGKAVLLRLGREEFLGAATLHPSIAIAVMREFSRRLRSADATIEQLSEHAVNPPSVGREEDPSTMQEEYRLQLMGAFVRDAVPFHKSLGLAIEVLEPGHSVLRVPWRDTLVGDPFTGTLHSGVISTLADASGSAAVFAMLDAAKDRVSTVDLHIDFVRPGWEEDLVCEAKIVRMGNRVAQAHMRIWNTEIPTDPVGLANPIATARAVYNVVRGPVAEQPIQDDAGLIDMEEISMSQGPES